METIKPIKLHFKRTNAKTDEPLTAAEMGKLWATYMGNTMAICILKYFLEKTDDKEIKQVVKNALNLSTDIANLVAEIFDHEHFPIPVGFNENDVNMEAPRLFEDEFYLHYLKYTGKAGTSLYSVAIPLMIRKDVREFFIDVMDPSLELLSQVNDLLTTKGIIMRQPVIPTPEKVDFVLKKGYLNGVFGDVRPLQALEITHLFANVENSAASKALLMGFSQVAKNKEVRDFFLKGKEIAVEQIEECSHQLHLEDLPSPGHLDSLVTTSTCAPFSDKLMLFHKLDTFTMKSRFYGNSISLCARRDLGGMYARFIVENSIYINEGAKKMIDHGWMEQPPGAIDRDTLASQ